jgi:hypothetical protein
MLTSKLLSGDPRLQSCAVLPTAHVRQGAQGTHVGRIQMALTLLGCGPIDAGEWRSGCYGSSTAATVLAYKRSRSIVNRSYQQQADDIVGVMTVQRLDAELLGLQATLPLAAAPRLAGNAGDTALVFEAKRCLARLHARATQGLAAQVFASASGAASPRPFAEVNDAAAAARALGDLAGRFDELLHTVLPETGTTADEEWVRPKAGGDRDILRTIASTRKVRRTYATEESESWRIFGPNYPTPSEYTPEWCGIYATRVWQQHFRGRHVHWMDGQGIFAGGRKVATSTNMRMLAPGDILVDQRPITVPRQPDKDHPSEPAGTKTFYPRHHVLVMGINRDRSLAYILQGNSGNGATAAERIVTRRVDFKLPDPTARAGFEYYSVDTLRDPALRYP